MNKKILFSSIFIFSFFIVTLGMRNPYLSGGNGPKQRPRAVTENTTKQAQAVVNQSQMELACLQTFAYTPPIQQILPLELSKGFSSATFIPQANLSARAPPLPATQSF